MIHADDSSILVVLLETHNQIWSSPQFCRDEGRNPKLSVGNFIEQVIGILSCPDEDR